GEPRVDIDGDRASGRLHPQRPDPNAADPDGPVEVPPPLLPAGVDGVGLGGAERSPEALLPTRVGIGDELDAVREVTLLEAFGEELQHQRPRTLRALRR